MLKTKQILALITAILFMALSLSFAQEEKKDAEPKADVKETAAAKKEIAVIETDFGTMKVEFYPKKAPETVKNFKKLVKKGFYNGLTFHRVIKDFMIQGGCPKGDGTGDPGYKIKAEFNDIKHVKGILSMARSRHPDSAGSQFFIMDGTKSYLDGKYTAFGKVFEGLDVIDKIVEVECKLGGDGAPSKPQKPVYINKISIVEVDEK